MKRKKFKIIIKQSQSLITATKNTFYRNLFILVLVLSPFIKTQATNPIESFTGGAYIIDMGQIPQTKSNGLKPYGLIYQLIVNKSVPVSWAINDAKAKDGIDFVAGGYTFRGSAFIIPSEYITGDITTLINTWKSQGVIVRGPITSSFNAPVFKELTSWPRAVLDDQNDQLVTPYYANAGIPTTSYVTAGNPTDLTSCGDVYVLPHADPHNWAQSWQTALINFIKNDQGYLWSGCHAVSALEGMVSGANFLSENGLQPWHGQGHHSNGTPPYTYNPAYDGDPIMQFMGVIDNATRNGSEQIYMPEEGENWRSTTKVAAYEPNHPDADPNEATVLVYGYAFGDPNYGMVMYEAGHKLNDNHSGGPNGPDNIAAQRAFFNFLLLAGVDKTIDISANIPATVISGGTINLTSSVSGGNPPYTYEWTSSCSGGSFSNPSSSSTNYTAPTVATQTQCIITLKVIDDCDRFSYTTNTVTVTINNPPVAVDDNYTTPYNTAKSDNVITNDSDPDLDNITVNTPLITDPSHGSVVQNTDGTFTYTPNTGYTGTDSYVYEICDDGTPSLCDQATVTITIQASGNNPPVAVDDSYTTPINTEVSGNVITNDSDPDEDNITVNTTLITDPTHGSVAQNADGTFTYTPTTGYTGTDSYIYEICDDGTPILCDQATVTINITTSNDSDGDGCTDDVDDYPTDPTRCLDNYYPANGYGTLAYEDLWPGKGDYDFNDLVCDYRFKMVTNSSNQVVELFGSFIIKAFGAGFENGFGFQLANDNISNSDISVTGYDLQEGYITLNGNGTEAGQSIPTIIVYDNSFNLMPHPGEGIGVNTDPPAPYVTPDTISVYMDITDNIYTLAQLDIPNFNPFIIVNLERGVEVHLPNYEPTDLVDVSYFGTYEDDSDLSTGRYYKTENNLPWAINIYQSFEYPEERVEIIATYLHFVEWAESGGTLFTDWYNNTDAGYRNNANIYVIP